ncbi:MAG: Asp-tRNA(Asn)/Glu-tRNA(Gln) amidotransferase subunit GatC [Eggerthellaceae bacterium]|nr:Asp-tRNA(Asn)/Glu-tRNA(Gln) amidotransferase subunit GatC [Eggerthellaceae bacterium]
MDDATLQALEHLNQLALTPKERTRAKAFFAAREADAAQLAAIDTDAVERQVFSQPVMDAYVNPGINVLRDDEPAQPFIREELLEQAPESMDGYWQVPRVLQ